MPVEAAMAETRESLCLLPESAELDRSLCDANVPTLLAAYAYLSRDSALLERFAPFIKPAFSMEQTAIPEDLAEELRGRLRRLLTDGEGFVPGSPAVTLMMR